jgi:mono/diheme cytochrome c family protein
LASAWRIVEFSENPAVLPFASTVAVAAMLTLTASAGGFAPFAASAQKPPAAAPVPKGQEGAAIYKKHCQLCHLDGNAPLEPMNFANRKWAHGSRLTDVMKVVREGVPGTAMLAYKDILTADEIRAVAEHVRKFDKSLQPEKKREKTPEKR